MDEDRKKIVEEGLEMSGDLAWAYQYYISKTKLEKEILERPIRLRERGFYARERIFNLAD